MKKTLSILMILLVTCLLFASCNRNNTDTDTTNDTYSDTNIDTGTDTGSDLNTSTSSDAYVDLENGATTDKDSSHKPEDAPILPNEPSDDIISSDTDTSANSDTSTNTDISTDSGMSTDSDNSDTPQNSVKAPNITITDYNGNEVTLESLRGKGIVLNFWASWCPPCKSEMPDFEEAYKEYGNDVHFVMLNLLANRETVSTAKDFYQQSGYTFPVYFDTYHDGYYSYNTSSIPQTFFIDKDGNLIAHEIGAISKSTLIEGIEEIK